ncbi:capsular polysaccharide biosynthesis protein [Chromobacterium violaceum]|uniref:capsular polysaccharide biosynthesis protein n=1 Tax=Chromobacterium violaceum TaxID=536 RepID=UPI001593B8AA|nr:capsular polysaccharide biosynthesis protein [Chromobacterium violaceum]
MTVAIFSRGIFRIPNLRALLRQPIADMTGFLPTTRYPSAVAGWGLRSSASRARTFATRLQIPYLALEDGFLRSQGLGVDSAPPLSLVVDDLGIYYDAGRTSRLESLISSIDLTDEGLQQAKLGLEWMCRRRLSKYNHAPAAELPPRNGRIRVLVLDQTEGDISVRLGGANAQTFQSMLNAASHEHPGAELWVKTHPDVVAGKKRGYLPQAPEDARLLAEDICPQSLLSQVDIVYTATSHMGFEALIAGNKVVCFGMPWYAGWGLTDDRHPDMPKLSERRQRRCTLEELFHAAYLQYARYIHPETGQPGTFFDVAEWIRLNRELREQVSGTLWCVGMSWWKRAVVWPFLKTPDNRLRFISRPDKLPGVLPPESKLVVWGMRPDVAEWATRLGLPLLRMEDGFLRSVGLGSNLMPPMSLVVDRGGLYYSPHSGSDLERLLDTLQLDDWQVARAARLRQQLVELKLSKYNVGGSFQLPAEAAGKTVVLVPGQVEDDASILEASPEIRGNLALLREARRQRPDAWLVYKPHPDVVSGNRRGAVPASELAALADQVAAEADIAGCLAEADEIHTMTSQAGFEALLQGKTVHCYGMPFYAGWGLTIDRQPMPHRQRRLTLDELIYGALIAYPRYALPGCDGFARVEAVMEYLRRQKTGGHANCAATHWPARQWRKARGLLRTLR